MKKDGCQVTDRLEESSQSFYVPMFRGIRLSMEV